MRGNWPEPLRSHVLYTAKLKPPRCHDPPSTRADFHRSTTHACISMYMDDCCSLVKPHRPTRAIISVAKRHAVNPSLFCEKTLSLSLIPSRKPPGHGRHRIHQSSTTMTRNSRLSTDCSTVLYLQIAVYSSLLNPHLSFIRRQTMFSTPTIGHLLLSRWLQG